VLGIEDEVWWSRLAHPALHSWAEADRRIIACYLPSKSPWLNPIEPKGAHGKRRVVEPARLLTAAELRARVCAAFDCPAAELLGLPVPLVTHPVLPEEVA
jgi:hypothetical protein